MENNKGIRSIGAILAATATIAAMLNASPAFATDAPETPVEVAALVSEAASAVAPAPEASDGGPVTVQIPADPNGSVVVTPDNGPALSVSLPSDVNVSSGIETPDGTVVYPGQPGEADVTVQPLENGARISTVLDSETKDRSFEYALPDGVEAEPADGGRIELTGPSMWKSREVQRQ